MSQGLAMENPVAHLSLQIPFSHTPLLSCFGGAIIPAGATVGGRGQEVGLAAVG